nr:PREDICTED: exopolygalacturonase-like [Musa acuminata subsp. malaccensis]
MADGVYNVKDYGAAGDGQTDNTKAFETAWSAACAVQGKATIVIPEGAYLLGPTIFKGPCKGIMVMQVVEDSMDKELLHGLTTNAKRQIIANPYPCFVTNATIKSISSIDSKFFHIHVFESRNIIFDSIKISAPQDSPNTDGIHIADSTNIEVANSIIGTGDDCISIGPGCTNLTIFKVLCGPGHGISVGSLGKNAGEKDVIGLKVSNYNLTGTTNGLRIKTLQAAYSSSHKGSDAYDCCTRVVMRRRAAAPMAATPAGKNPAGATARRGSSTCGRCLTGRTARGVDGTHRGTRPRRRRCPQGRPVARAAPPAGVPPAGEGGDPTLRRTARRR